MAPPDSADDDTPSPPPTDHANVRFGTPENGAYSSIWNQVINSPYERVALTTSFVSTSPVLHGRDPTASSSSWSGSLLFSSPRSGNQELTPSSSPSVNVSYVPSLVLENEPSATTPALSPGVELLPQPLGQLAGQVLPPVYSPPPYPLSLPTSGIHTVLPVSSTVAPPFSRSSLVVELPLRSVLQPAPQAPQALPLPPPPPYFPPSGQLDDYMNGGAISNALVLPFMVSQGHIMHINQQWSYVFFHAWHTVFHDTHTSFPPSNLIQLANRALSNAYVRWEQLWPNDPLLPAPITIDGVAMTAIRNYNAPSPIKPLLNLFNRGFKGQIRSARKGAMSHLLRCTLGALVICQVVPFLPTPHIDIRPSHPNPATFLPRVYSETHKDFYSASVEWDERYGCRIWHAFDVDRIVWFGNVAVRRFLSMLLSHDENAPCALGVRRARGGPPNVITSWGPLVELDNNSVLALLAKTLASLSTSINGDVVQRPRQFSLNQSDGHRNRAVNELTQGTFRLLQALDDLALPYPALLMQQREDGRSQLIRLKEDLGFGI